MTQPTAHPTTPVACPACVSDQIKGPDLPGTGLSYWRCLKCGIVWNPERPPDRSRDNRLERTMRRNSGTNYWHDK
jgi:hypothetical protein